MFKPLSVLAVTGALAIVISGCTLMHQQKPSADTSRGKVCPDWSSDPVSNYSNEDFSNFGCAYHNNLYVHIKDKADYERGGGKTTEISPLRDGTIVQTYLGGGGASSSSSSGGASAASAASSSSSR